MLSWRKPVFARTLAVFLATLLAVASSVFLAFPGISVADVTKPVNVNDANWYVYMRFDYFSFFTSFNDVGQPLNLKTIKASVQLERPEADVDGDGYLTAPMLVWGEPHGDYSGGQYRYVGYGRVGENVSNVAFPPDSPGIGVPLHDKNWVPEPWNDAGASAFLKRYGLLGQVNLDNIPDPYIRERIRWGFPYAAKFNGFSITPGLFNSDIYKTPEKYVHIIIPPTPDTWGMGVMVLKYKTSGGRIAYGYASVPMPPEPPKDYPVNTPMCDLRVTVLSDISPILPWQYGGKKAARTARAKVVVYSNSTGDPVDAILTVNGPAGPRQYSFRISPGETKIFDYDFTVYYPGRYKVSAEVWPVISDLDPVPENNKDSCYIWVLQEDPPLEIHTELGG